uniref:Uncharacterized protein n=1 Tax=viral metagenome TaxID=1070528 RepID=A0A6H1Z7A9_9ZZZZ
MKQTYIQLQDLPFSNKGSIWEVEADGKEIIAVYVNGVGYTFCSPGLQMAIAKYYASDGSLDMTGEWFELAGSKEEKKLVLIRMRDGLQLERNDYQSRVDELQVQIDRLEKEIEEVK